MNRTAERREILAILDQLKGAALATFPEALRANPETPHLNLDPAMWEKVRSTAEGLGMSLEIGAVATLRGILAGTRFTMRVSTAGDFDELARVVRKNFAPAPQQRAYVPTPPRRTYGSIEDAEHNLSQAKASGNAELIAMMEQALAMFPQRSRMEVVHSQEPTQPDEPMDLSTTEKVAAEFARSIQRELSPEELASANAKNEKRRQRGPLKWKCATQNYIDALPFLEEAWTEIVGKPCDFASREQCEMYNDAFTLARDSNYEPATIGRDKEKAA